LREKLEACCQPLTPEEVLGHLRILYDALERSQRWVSEEELEAVNAAIEVLKLTIKEGE
jgi:hypothetical protein